MNGQILASPRLIVPSSVDNSSVSNILSSLTLPSSAAPTPVPTHLHQHRSRQHQNRRSPAIMSSTAGNRSPEQLCTVPYVSSVDISTKNRQKAVSLIIIPLMIPSRKEICGACGGVIKEESHLYTHTTETAEGGVRIHKGNLFRVWTYNGWRMCI